MKDSLVEDLAAEGFQCYESSLGGAGVLWHDGVPAWLEPGRGKSRGLGPGVDGGDVARRVLPRDEAASAKGPTRPGAGVIAVAAVVAAAISLFITAVGRRHQYHF